MQKTADEIAATCTTAGKTAVYTCANGCGKTEGGEEIKALGHTLTQVEAKAPTCTEAGYEAYEFCSVCDYTTYAEIAATGHTYNKEITAPTCEAKGYTTYTCDCGDSYVADYVDAKGHDMQKTADEIAATCTTAGKSAVYTCANGCGKTEGGEVITAAHNEITIEGVDPTCNEAGQSEGKICTVCGTMTVVPTEIPATGEHDIVAHGAKEATCNDAGWNAYVTCKNCTYTTYEEIGALGHDEKAIPAVEATCTQPGHDDGIVCKRCGAILDPQIEVPALDHNYSDETITVPATCTEAGEKKISCTRCDDFRTETINALGHDVEILPAQESTCTDKGLTEGKKCKTCGNVLVAQTETAMKPHTEVIVPAVDATCTTVGYTQGTKCDVCGVVLTAQTEIPVKAHTYENNVCTVCGADDPDHYFEMDVNDALAAEDGKKVSVEGTVIKIEDAIATFAMRSVAKNVTIVDGEGHSIVIYNVTADVSLGDVIVVNGEIGSDGEIKVIIEATVEVVTEHVCSEWTEATCQNLAACVVCGTTKGELGDHNYESGTCTVCGDKQGQIVVTDSVTAKYTGTTTTNLGTGNSASTLGLDSTIFNVKADKGGNQSTNVGVNANGTTRLYYGSGGNGNSLTFTATKDGYKIKSIKIVFYSTTNGTNCAVYAGEKLVTTTSGSTATVEVEINATSFKLVNANTTNVQIHIKSIEITYEYTACAHNMEETEAKVDATCTVAGKEATYTCSYCGVTEGGKTISALGHNYDDGNETVAPDCETAGEKVYTCERCKTTKTEVIAALGHAYGEGEIITNPTCDKPGEKVATCENCGETDSVEIPALAHEYDGGKITTDATCGRDGVKTYTCGNCGATYTEAIEATGEHNYGTDNVCTGCCLKKVEPTVEYKDTTVNVSIKDYASANSWSNGTQYKTLKMDGNITVTANGNSNTGKYYTSGNNWRMYANESAKLVFTAANGCTIKSIKITYTIQDSGKISYGSTALTSGKAVNINATTAEFIIGSTSGSKGKVFITAIEVVYTTTVVSGGEGDGEPTYAHVAGDAVTENDVAATCTTKGSYDSVVYCENCGAEMSRETFVTEIIDHTYTEKVTAPTCEEKGYTTYTCDCGDSYVDDYVDAKGHNMQQTEAKVDATCTVAGKEAVYTCANGCGKTEGGEEIAAPGHTLTQVDAKAPTCTEAGYEAYEYCSACDYTTYAEIKATGHTYNEKVTAPTCEADGYTTYTCACGHSYTDNTVVAKGHNMQKTADEIAATCTVAGKTAVYTCANGCGKTEGGAAIAIVAHSMAAATCKAPATCSVCGYTEGGLAAHAMVNNTCTVCGYAIKTYSSFMENYNGGVAGTTGAIKDIYTLDNNTTVIVNDGLFTTEIRIYEQSNRHTWAMIYIHDAILNKLTINAGKNNNTSLEVYGSVNGYDWDYIGNISTAENAADYVVNGAAGYKYIAFDAIRAQVRIINFTVELAPCTGHVYANDCDSTCELCDHVRETAIEHQYSAVCDPFCDVCGSPRNAELHTYAAGCDDHCNVCGAEVYAFVYRTDCTLNDGKCIYCAEKSEEIPQSWLTLTEAKNQGYVGVNGNVSSDDGYLKGAAKAAAWQAPAGLDKLPNSSASAGKKVIYVSDVANNDEKGLDIGFYGWVAFTEAHAVSEWGLAVDSASDWSQVYTNTQNMKAQGGYCELYSGVLGNPAGYSGDIITHTGSQNARRYCIQTIWLGNRSTILSEIGEHTFYILAKMDDGTVVIVQQFIIEVVKCSDGHDYIVSEEKQALMCRCGDTLATADTLISGKELVENYNTGSCGSADAQNFTTCGATEGYGYILGAGDKDGKASTASLAQTNPNFQKYVVIVYKATENSQLYWCHYNTSASGGGAHTGVNIAARQDGYGVVAFETYECIHQRVDIRFNIGGSANCETEIAYIATFSSFDDYLVFANNSLAYQNVS